MTMHFLPELRTGAAGTRESSVTRAAPSHARGRSNDVPVQGIHPRLIGVLELLRSKVPLVTDEGPRLDEDPEFTGRAQWANTMGFNGIATALTCQTDP
jgi:hypothetical protein